MKIIPDFKCTDKGEKLKTHLGAPIAKTGTSEPTASIATPDPKPNGSAASGPVLAPSCVIAGQVLSDAIDTFACGLTVGTALG